MAVRIPDDSDFSSFKAQCLATQGWSRRYHKGGVTVWCRPDDDDDGGVQKIKMQMACGGVSAQTLYDVLHDGNYRRKWDANMIHAYDIGRLTANADVGYYSWRCPGPLKNRDFVTLRSWLPLGGDFLIINSSVKHAAMRKLYKASQKYPEWKRRHQPHLKPWLFPEQNASPRISVAELSPQRADSLDNIDESGLSEDKTERGGDDDDDDDDNET